MAAAFRAAALAFGGVDLVVNNAGLSISKPLLETTEQDWDLQHDVMAKGSFLVSREAARIMIEQGMGGDIVYISSKNSLFAGPNNIAYGATKADQAHQVRLLAAELGPHQIRVNGINPDGVVRGSGIFAGGWGASRAAVYGVPEEELGEFYAQRTLLKREVLPDHVADAVFALTGGDLDPDDGAARAGRLGRRRRLPAMRGDGHDGPGTFAAVDLGASSGRVMVARVGPDRLDLQEAHRFPNRPVRTGGRPALGRAAALRRRPRRAARRRPRRRPARRDRHRQLGGRLRPARRRRRAAGQPGALPRRPARVRGRRPCTPSSPPEELYRISGLQHLPFNTVFQLAAAPGHAQLDRGPPAAARPRPAGPLADRRRRRRGHQRLDDRAAGRRHPGVVPGALIDRLGLPAARSSRR